MCLTTVQKDNNIVYIDIIDHNNKKVRYEIKDIDWRKLTPIECERLQTVADNYTAKGLDENFIETKISNSQRYKMIGNGWTVDVIVHIMKELLPHELKIK
ncbi:MAG: DNA cytosine methyltransferase [Sulfurimonas sp.]|uniref:DNA cytosine methyltransferase n=1 Tax=Sulfurimonas sp. TaxID=2022749 RepID=UPI002602BC7F|nr:DNA cytosine methyltransferase [Sulfurimonas sp.]MDD5373926.1 DNA cytosine methyltransferase [Sulfurimonas sp.]